MAVQKDIARLLKSGDMVAAMAAAKDAVRAAPGAVEPRLLMFQILALAGEWDRSATQLKVVGDLSSDAAPLVTTCQSLLRSEITRIKVFAGAATPVVLGRPDAWLGALLEALRLEGTGETAAGSDLRAQALEQAPASGGVLTFADGCAPFQWIADADMRLGPVLEAVVNGRYVWLPLAALKRIEAEPPGDLRDFVWFPVRLTLVNGGEIVAFIPSRYVGTPNDPDDFLKMARRTEWRERADGLTVGLGQRMFATDQGEYALFDMRSLELDNVGEPMATVVEGGNLG